LQIERRYTKNEILEIYLNYMYMGPGTYGVEAASKYFFGHSAREISLAEAAVLVIQLSSPVRYNPLDNPNVAMERQRVVLDRMIEFGYATEEEAEESYNEYWGNYDYTRASTAAYFHREDKAPWFSEYVRRELDSMMYGTMDYYRDGYIVHTTLDLRHQEAAEKYMAEGIIKANRDYARSRGRSNLQAERTYIPIVNLLTLAFNLDGIHTTSSAQNEQKAFSRYTKTINPIVDMAALAFGIPDLKIATNASFANLRLNTEQNVVEGALISIENSTGYITAIVGGSKYDESNQLIRATQANVQPGSSFKPLYYSAAIDSRKMTATSLIYDVPIVFYNEDGTPYIPLNFRGEWKGSVLLYDALSHSMNVPSLKVLDTIGFDAAIDRAAALLGITSPTQIRNTFPRVYPLGLGIIAISPIKMARAFAVFGNEGRDVTPMAIRSVEDRNGRMVIDNEKEIRLQQRRAGNAQLISRENAYVMTKILEKTVEQGTLAHGAGWGAKFTFRDENNKSFKMPVAGKTGTTQNWSDAWAVGYSPYYTTAIWFGFDKPGNSLGVELTGATLSGPIWGDYMREIHQGLPRKDFARPATGIIDVTVCAKSGLLRNSACNEGDVTLPFLTGTQPTHYCTIHGNTSFTTTAINTMRDDVFWLDNNSLYGSLPMPILPTDIIPNSQGTQNQNNRNNNNNNRGSSSNNRNPSAVLPLWDFNNPWLDDDPFDYLDLPGNININPPDLIPDGQVRIEPLTPVQTQNMNNSETEFFHVIADDPVNDSGNSGLITHNIINDDVGYGLEIPSYNPLSD
jgi:penicillin-binding protein 1A